MPAPLAHVTVLDLSRVLAGPWCTQHLADLGATVWKVERPDGGDDTRAWGPPYLRDADGRDTTEAAYYLACNRGKRSIAVDLAHPDGQAIVRALARRADVLVENYKVGALARYGLDAEALAADNPRLVTCSITGFGQDGPYASRAGYDFVVQGLCGLMSVTGEPDGRPGGGPQKAGVAVTDLVTGLFAATGILAALAERERTGRGRRVDAALLDSAVAMMSVMNLNHLVASEPPGRSGNAHPNIVPYEVFACADGPLILAVGNDAQFAKFCEAAGVGWADDPRFARNADRVHHRDTLVPMVAAAMRGLPRRTWLDRLEPLGVPCGPINTLAQVFDDPQVQARGMRFDLPHPLGGRVPQVGFPLRIDGARCDAQRAPPLLGEHTAEVLREVLGYDAWRIEALARDGVVGIR